MKSLDKRTMLRFASGELGPEEESTFLARCEIAPESWRDAVLAVAEHRRLVEALGELAADDAPSPNVPSPDTQPRWPTAARAANPGRWRSAAAAAAALAAGLLLGVAGARLTGFFPGREPANAREMQVVTMPAQPQSAKQAESAATQLEPTLPKRTAPDGVPVSNVVAATMPTDVLQMPPTISETQRAVLGNHGFQVEEEPTLYVIDGGNGTRWAVPTQRTTLHYVKR
jgi:hypothetical protein